MSCFMVLLSGRSRIPINLTVFAMNTITAFVLCCVVRLRPSYCMWRAWVVVVVVRFRVQLACSLFPFPAFHINQIISPRRQPQHVNQAGILASVFFSRWSFRPNQTPLICYFLDLKPPNWRIL